MESSKKYDLIVVGLGCVGLSTTYYCSKKNLKVLGLEMNSTSGEIGTSSSGTTRIYRFTSPDMIKNEMMKVSYGIFKQAEKELADLKSTTPEFANIETELLTQADLLSLGEKDSKYISSMAKSSPDLEWITPSEISQRYPGFENIPENYIGWVSKEAGVVRVKNALNGFRILSQQNGADLRYNSKVSEISKNKVIWEDGNIYHSDHVVVAWGGYTTDYFDTTCTKSKVIQTETFWLSGNKGFPGCFIEASPEGEVYGLNELYINRSSLLSDYCN